MTNKVQNILNENVLKSQIREKIEEVTAKLERDLNQVWKWMGTINEKMKLLEDLIYTRTTKESERR